MDIKIKKLPKSELFIEGELSAEKFASYENKALKHLGERVELDGFRKGHVPEAMLRSKIPEMTLMEEMAEMALGEMYPELLEENKIDAIGRPEIAITKIAKGSPLGFTIKTAVLPEVTMPDYKKIAKENSKMDASVDVDEKEIDDALLSIRKMRAHDKMHENDTHEEGEEAKHDHGEIKDEDLPPLDDEFAKSLGQFASIDDLKTKLKENLKLEKLQKEKEKVRVKILEGIIEKMKADVPEILVQSEVEKMIQMMSADMERMGMKFEDYLTQIKKSEAEVREEFKKEGEKRAMLSLALSEIAKIEKIVADEERIQTEVSALLARYADADPARARMHVESALTNEKVLAFLESQSDEK